MVYYVEMAKLTHEDILKLAQLSRLNISDDEISHFEKEIEKILDYVELLQSVDLENIEPTYQVTGLQNVMRADEVQDYGVTPEELLQNAPGIEDGHIKVKRMIA